MRTMTRTKGGKWLCHSRGRDTIYEAREVIDPQSDNTGCGSDSRSGKIAARRVRIQGLR